MVSSDANSSTLQRQHFQKHQKFSLYILQSSTLKLGGTLRTFKTHYDFKTRPQEREPGKPAGGILKCVVKQVGLSKRTLRDIG